MAAKNVSKWVKAAVQPFEDMGSKIGGIAKSMPKYAPILPPSLWGSMYGAWRIADQVGNLQAKAAEKKVNESSIGRMVWLWEQASETDMKKVQELLKTNHWIGSNESKDIVSKLVANGGKHDQTHTFKEFWEFLNKKFSTINDKKLYLTGWWMDPEIADKLATKIHSGHNIDPHTNKELEELWKRAGSKWATNGTTTNSSISAKIEISKDGTNKITILNEPLQFKLKNNGDIDGNITGVEALKWKNMNQSKEDFEKSLQNSWNLTKSAAAAIVKAIEKEGWIFNSKPSTTTPPTSGWGGWWH